jgi:hypothetical protein
VTELLNELRRSLVGEVIGREDSEYDAGRRCFNAFVDRRPARALFSPERNAADAAEIHRDVREQVFEKYGGPSAPPRPWWKRLFGRP